MNVDLKNPWVIGGGVLLAVVFLARGGNTAANNTASANTSATDAQSALAQSNVALASIEIPAQYQYLAAVSNNQVSGHIADTQMISSVLQSALQNQGNIYTSAIAANANTSNTFAPNAPALASINGKTQIAVTNAQTSAAEQIAQINANAQVAASNNSLLGSLGGGVLNLGSKIL